MKLSTITLLATAAVATLSSFAAAQSFTPFIIRQGAGLTPLTITDVAGVVTTNIDEASEKTGYGTSFFDGQSISSIPGVSYTRLDAGPKTPYVNIWVTDGTNHAVIAPNVYSSYGPGGAPITPNINGLDIQSLGVNVYETNTADLSWLAPGAVYNSAFQGLATVSGGQFTPVKVGDLFDTLTVFGNTTFGGTGAPKGGTGLTIVFGDTQGNFTQAQPYMISNVAVPEPTTLAALAGAGVLGLRRRRA